MSDEQETVTITLQEYEKLLRDADMLMCLEDAGVDNWAFYGDAVWMFRELQERKDGCSEG